MNDPDRMSATLSHSLTHCGSFLLVPPQQVFCSPEPPAKTSTPEDFIRMTKGITMATAKAVAAGNSCRQEDVIATANLSRRAIADMLRACKVEMLVVRQKLEAALGRNMVGEKMQGLGGLGTLCDPKAHILLCGVGSSLPPRCGP